MPAVKSKISRSKRGDTIIEVMFAFAIFAMVAILTVAMMNSGLSASERTLELVTTRSELNAQAEALRFIHSSYISELKLPTCGEVAAGEKCQQYTQLWKDITNHAIKASDFADPSNKIEYPPTDCAEVYKDNNKLLNKNNAFVLNARDLLYERKGIKNNQPIIWAEAKTAEIFTAPTLNARIVYTSAAAGDSSTFDDNMNTLTKYTRIARAEGIWVIPVEGPDHAGAPQYYDFYIDTCWNGTNNPVPTAIDTVIRLYNPAGA